MTSALWFFVTVAAVAFVGFVGLSVFEAVREYRQDKWASGNWALQLWWRYLSHTPAAHKRRWEFVSLVALCLLVFGTPIGWLTGAFFAWQAEKLDAYLEWTGNVIELAQKGLEVFRAFRG